MEKKFEVNQVKPGDPGYVYDKRMEFKKVEAPVDDDSPQTSSPSCSYAFEFPIKVACSD